MKKYIYIILLFLFSACEKILEVNPRQSVNVDVALTSLEKVQAAVNNVYSYLKSVNSYGRDMLPISEALSDNSRIINRAGGRYVNQGNNAINNHFGGWLTHYQVINECNLILKALPGLTSEQDVKDPIEGEVKCLRALFYFNLMRIYAYEPMVELALVSKGGVPLMKEGVNALSQITYPARSSIADIYTFLYQDLTDAVAKASTSGAPSRITKAAALALFSKVALYKGDYLNAIDYATQALNSGVGNFQNNSGYVPAWRASSHPESIFEVLFKNPNENIGVNESIQSAYSTRISLTSNQLGGYGAVVPTTAFLNLMSANDVRKQLYQTGISRSNSVVIECTKFLGKTGVLYMDNIPVIRVSELYLIRAEAYAKSGNELLALDDVNKIRTRAGLNAVVGLVGTTLIDEILLQRRLELAFEGDRWFDLKRLGKDVIKTTGNVLYSDPRILAPIPLSEVQVNPQLKQNNGY